jgi:thioredoxin 1
MDRRKIQTGFKSKIKIKKAMINVIYFSAPWCGPCRTFGPVMEKVAEHFNENDLVEITKVNADEDPDTAALHGIRSIPALVYLKEGETVHQSVGVKSQADVIEKINELLA